MPYAFVESNLAGGMKSVDGSRREFLHAIAGKESAEVERGISKAVLCQPTTHTANHLHVVVDGRDNEVGQFYPYAGLLHGEDGVEDRGKAAAADALVDVVAERLEVDVGGIEIGQEVGQRLLTDVARRHEDVPQPFSWARRAVSDTYSI